jgi:thiol-disulfide isomerase/thioredoxin
MRTILLMTLLMVLFVSAGAQSSQSTASLTLKDLHGRQFRLADYKGKVVLVNFWATWCQPCRTEIPDLIKKQREYRYKGLQIVGVTYPPEKISQVRRFVRKLRMNYPVAMGTQATRTLFTSSETLPLTVVIDRDGAVRDVIEGIMYPDEFDEKVKPLLSSNRAARVAGPD